MYSFCQLNHIAGEQANTALQLYSSLGVKVWQENLGMISVTIRKNVYLENKLVAGVYMLFIQRSDTLYSMKIVISK